MRGVIGRVVVIVEERGGFFEANMRGDFDLGGFPKSELSSEGKEGGEGFSVIGEGFDAIVGKEFDLVVEFLVVLGLEVGAAGLVGCGEGEEVAKILKVLSGCSISKTIRLLEVLVVAGVEGIEDVIIGLEIEEEVAETLKVVEVEVVDLVLEEEVDLKRLGFASTTPGNISFQAAP